MTESSDMALHADFLLARSGCVIIVVLLLSVCRPSNQQACGADHFACDNGRCINTTYVCDYIDHCYDRSDERNCQYPPPDMTKVLVCTMNSQENQRSYVQKLFGDPDDYAYKFANDTFADKLPIHQNRVYFRAYDFLHSVSIDYSTQTAYFSNNFFGRLEYGLFIYNNDTTSYFFNFVPDSKQINAVAIDWVSKNLYWTDGLYKVIGVIRVSSTSRTWKAIIDRDLSSPQDIAVNPVQHYLFWSDGDGNYNNAKIERSDLAGNNRTVLLSSAQGLVSPTTLVIDFSSQKLYWLDLAAQKIGYVNFDGSDYHTFTISSLSQVSAMTIYRSYMYFGDKQEPIIYMYNKTSMDYISSFRMRESGGITDMAMFASDVQPFADSPCTSNNGGCSQFCFTTAWNARVCDCAPGFFLGLDGATCSPRPLLLNEEYLLVADHNQQNIYQLQLNSGEVRALPVSPCRPVSLAFDPSIKGLYITCDDEGDLYRIHKKTLDGKIDEIVYSAPQSSSKSQLVGLVLDSERQLLYYADHIQGVIAEITTSGLNRREIFSNSSARPRALVVDADSRRMYWSDCSGPATIQTARIEDGGDQQILINDNEHSCIVSIAIDFNSKLMYWASIDKPAVEMSSLNGTGRVKLLSESVANYTGLTLYNNYLYISDAYRRNIIKFDLASGAMSLQAPELFTGAWDVIHPFEEVTGVSTASTPGEEGPNWTIIIAITASVGGAIVMAVLITVVVLIVVSCRKSRRSVDSSPVTNIVCLEPLPVVPVSPSAPTYEVIPDAAVLANKVSDDSKYENLHHLANNSTYVNVDGAPHLPFNDMQPEYLTLPSPNTSVDESGYLKLSA